MSVEPFNFRRHHLVSNKLTLLKISFGGQLQFYPISALYENSAGGGAVWSSNSHCV